MREGGPSCRRENSRIYRLSNLTPYTLIQSRPVLLRVVQIHIIHVEGAGTEAWYILLRPVSGPCAWHSLNPMRRGPHIHLGVYVLRRPLSEHDHLVDLFDDRVAALHHAARDDPEQILADCQSGIVPFDVDPAAYRQCYLDRLEETRRRVAGPEQ